MSKLKILQTVIYISGGAQNLKQVLCGDEELHERARFVAKFKTVKSCEF